MVSKNSVATRFVGHHVGLFEDQDMDISNPLPDAIGYGWGSAVSYDRFDCSMKTKWV